MRGDCVRQRDPLGIGPLAKLVLVGHRPGRRARPEERAAEARALLVGPADEPHGDRRLSILGDPPQHFGAGDDVQRAVQPTAVRHRVEVTAEQELLVRGTGQRPPLVARLVELHLDPVELGRHPVLRLHPGVRPRHALRAVLVAGQLLELTQLGDGSLGVERHAERA